MERRFLDLLELYPRSQKPRTRGLTFIREGGSYPISWLHEMLDEYSDYVDAVKVVITCLPMHWRSLEKRIQLYRDHDVAVAMDDPTFSLAYYQHKAREFLHTVREMGFTYVQIETHL